MMRPPRFRFLAVAAPFFLVAACGSPLRTPPDYRERAYDPPAPSAWPKAEEEAPVDDRPIEGLDLAAARALALQRNHTVAAASAAVLAAEARIAEARAAFLPTLSMGINRTKNAETRTVSIPGGGSFSLSPSTVSNGQASLTVSLFSFGRDLEAVDAARAAVDTQILDERSVRQKLLYDVTQAWYRLHEAGSQVSVASDSLAAAEKQLQDATNIFEAERTTRDAVLTAKVDELTRRQELLVAKNAEIHARRILNVLLVRDADAPLTIAPAADFAPVALDVPRLKALAREHNPSLLSFRSRRDELHHLRESTERSFLPEFVGSLGAEYSDFTEASGYSTNYTATVGVQWTPVQGGRRLGRLEEIHHRLIELRERELQAIQDLELAIDRAALDLAETESAVEVARQSIDAATENHRIISDRFRAGKTTAREVLEAQRTLTGARFVFNRARFLHRTILAQLEALLGVAEADWTAGATP